MGIGQEGSGLAGDGEISRSRSAVRSAELVMGGAAGGGGAESVPGLRGFLKPGRLRRTSSVVLREGEWWSPLVMERVSRQAKWLAG